MEQINKYYRHGEKAYNHILSTAEEILVARGIDHVTLSEIVEACGIMRTTFYRYFKNKEELLWCIMRKHTLALIDKLKARIGDKNCSTYEKFEMLVQLLIEGFESNPGSYLFVDLFKETYLTATSTENSDLVRSLSEEDGYHPGDLVKMLLVDFHDGSVQTHLDPKATAVSVLYSAIIIVTAMARQTVNLPGKYQIEAVQVVRFGLNALLFSIKT